MKKWIFLNLVIASTFILGACSTSNNVVSNKLISKRKYTKGFHLNKKSKLKDSDETLAVASKKDDKHIKVKSSPQLKKASKNHEEEFASSTMEEVISIHVTPEENTMASIASVDSEFDSEEVFSDVEQVFVADSNEKGSIVNKSSNSAARPDMSDPVWLIVMILLALILPPVAIAIYSGITGIFWLDLILFLIAWGGFAFFRLTGLLHLAAIIIAFLVIFDVI